MPRLLPIAALLAVLVSGCFRSHGLAGSDTGVDATRADASRPDAFAEDAFAPSDAGIDAAADDAGGCMRPGPSNPLHACVLAATGSIPAGEPYTLPLTYSRCQCPQTRSCSVVVDGSLLSLETAVCDDEVPCDECEFDLGCELPPLAAGHYFVDVDGVRSMEVDAVPRFMPMVARPLCAPVLDPPDASLVCNADDRLAPSVPMTICRPAPEDVGRYVRFDLVVGCASCFDVTGGCETQIDGSRVVVRPHVLRCDCPTCGACVPTCTPLTIACVSPPLSAGRYDLVVQVDDGEHFGGELEIRDVFEPGERVCTDVF